MCSFLKHYKKVTVEGNNPERLINLCISRKLNLKNIKYVSDYKVNFYVAFKEYEILLGIAGGRYRVTLMDEYGCLFRIKCLMKRKVLLTGILIFLCVLTYQSFFVAEIEVLGYESISEQMLRQSMKEAGFYEGCRKNIQLEKVKLNLYEDFNNIAWIGIKYKGNLAQVTIVETDYIYEKEKISDVSPCNIVAAVDGYINSVDPEEGIRTVEDGAFVKAGDVIISGIIPLEKTTYEEVDDKENISYVHAAGTVEAKVPVRLNYYIESCESVKDKTGRKMLLVAINDRTLLEELCPYEMSTKKPITLLNWIKPLKFKFQLNLVEEVEVTQREISEKEIKNLAVNEIHKFAEEKLPDNAQILNKSLNFTWEKNIIYIGVTLETLQKIGIEEEIIVDKSNR